MDRCNKVALAGAIIVSLGGAMFTKSFPYHLYFDRLPIEKLLIAVAGWSLTTYGPILVAALFWHLAKRSSVGWLLHVLLPLCFFGLLRAGNKLMLSTQVLQDWDATMGGPFWPGFFVTITALLVYYSALVASKLSAPSTSR